MLNFVPGNLGRKLTTDSFPLHVEHENGLLPKIILSVISRDPDIIASCFLDHRIIEWFGLEGTFEDQLANPPALSRNIFH